MVSRSIRPVSPTETDGVKSLPTVFSAMLTSPPITFGSELGSVVCLQDKLKTARSVSRDRIRFMMTSEVIVYKTSTEVCVDKL